MNKILFLIGSYFPEPSPNSICVRNVMLQLLKNDINPVCIAINNKGFKSVEIIENIEVNRIKNRLLNRIIIKNINKTDIRLYIAKSAVLISRMQGAIYAFLWPLVSISLIFRYYNRANKLYKKEELKVVVAVYKGIESLLAGLLLKYKYPNIQFVCYTLDCMSRSLVPKILNTNIALNSVKRWERFIFTKADYICIMQSHQKHYQQDEYKRFQSKFVIMDIPLFELNDTNPNVDLNKKREKINLVFTGSMSESTADPSYFIKILESIDDMVFEFNIYGGTSSVTISNNIKNSYLYGKKIFWHGVVPPEIAAQKQKEADMLLSFGNDNECMIPSKIFEYIALKKHVMHFYKSLTDSAIPYFEKYGNSTLIQEEQKMGNAVPQKVRALFMNIPVVKIDNDVLLEKFYNNTAEPMADFIISLLKK